MPAKTMLLTRFQHRRDRDALGWYFGNGVTFAIIA
ncbi:hypothetical protein GGQ96_001449 [Sphingomonas abaci]|uniref:Uncharacterized protein n=1 Tax=Sphingomonas abaci TaxID=237611 RepID=A0A7W7EXS6_9SPHN|nr:hypothetical protein [Sphingomonas abaci]